MRGVFFGAEQIRPGVIAFDCDDDYYERPGTLIPLTCSADDVPVPESDISGDTDEHRTQVLEAAQAEADTPCPECGGLRSLAAPLIYGRPACHALVVRCDTAYAVWRAAAYGESGPVYRYRPFAIAEDESAHAPKESSK